ncbi:MAG TPA: CoA-binding protein [Dehalococcoidia bacterium]|nr:CoA-binding protein [Dehalococcoidia bacterium]
MSAELEILTRYRTIVVVGASSLPEKPSHYVSAYMQAQGYRIIPVNPEEHEVLGERCYPDLASVPEQVAFVNVFRRPQYCAEVARAAVAAGAQAIWLQQGIVSSEARRIAEAAGLSYIEDECVMAVHRRAGSDRLARTRPTSAPRPG